MSVINNLLVTPNRVVIACEFLHYLGQNGGKKSFIEKQLSPLKRAEREDGEEVTGSTIATSVINEIEKLKLITTLGDECRISDDFIHLTEVSFGDVLSSKLCPIMTSPDLAEPCGQSDVPDALSWLLSQDPFALFPRSGGVHAERITQQLGAQDSLKTILSNDSRFHNLIYWARYFGFAEWITLNSIQMVLPDPTSYLSKNLDQIFTTKDDEIPISLFVGRLAEICPIFETGLARNVLESRKKLEFQLKEHHLSKSLSLALNRLDIRGLIELKSSDDAEVWVLNLNDSMVTYSHIRYLGGASK
jgi:hypothetical protein